jgi:protein-tyrosine phosphatase
LLERYINMGMLSQLTRGSLLGHWGEEVRQFSLDLLRQGMAHIISSDTHSPHTPRTPELGEALKIASEIVGCQKAMEMVNDTPRAILENRPLTAPTDYR